MEISSFLKDLSQWLSEIAQKARGHGAQHAGCSVNAGFPFLRCLCFTCSAPQLRIGKESLSPDASLSPETHQRTNLEEPQAPAQHPPPKLSKTLGGLDQERQPSFLATNKRFPVKTKTLHSECSLPHLPLQVSDRPFRSGVRGCPTPQRSRGLLPNPPGSPDITCNYPTAPFILVPITFPIYPEGLLGDM